jgi:hypothetical protein
MFFGCFRPAYFCVSQAVSSSTSVSVMPLSSRYFNVLSSYILSTLHASSDMPEEKGKGRKSASVWNGLTSGA